jgi:broad specificity phosphatase PhoE
MDTNIFVTRHLQRIDTEDSEKRENAQQWNKNDSKNPSYIDNPYLVDKAFAPDNIDRVIANFKDGDESGVRVAKNIDIIITSPFMRCLKTSILLKDKINSLKDESDVKIDKIFVNFGLSEIVDDATFPNNCEFSFSENKGCGSLNIDQIWNFSTECLSSKFDPESLREYLHRVEYRELPDMNPDIFEIEDNNLSTIEFEDDAVYSERICSTIKKIYDKYRGRNILIVTHSDVGRVNGNCIKFDVGNEKGMGYLDVLKVIEIQDVEPMNSAVASADASEAASKYKYLKYKRKYLKLIQNSKNKISHK